MSTIPVFDNLKEVYGEQLSTYFARLLEPSTGFQETACAQSSKNKKASDVCFFVNPATGEADAGRYARLNTAFSEAYGAKPDFLARSPGT